ncbi:MAG: hypothetical protein GQ579_08145 [Bacteroidales bacterium]|nr:hypothetical protein [Bacteroidales bacterium]
MRCGLEPEGGEFQGGDLPHIDQINDLPPIHTVPGKPVGMPGNDPYRILFLMNGGYQFIEYRPSGLLSTLTFLEDPGNVKALPPGKFIYLCLLCFHGHDLTLFIICRFPDIYEVFHTASFIYFSVSIVTLPGFA